MRKNACCLLTALILLALFLQPLSVRAEEALDVTRECSLTLEYSSEGNGFENMEIRIYRIAEIHANGDYALVDPFSALPVKIHGIRSQTEWREAADTLAAYITAEQIPATAAGITDHAGNVLFEGLQTGVYLVMDANGRIDRTTYAFENFCVFLPTPQQEGGLNYNVYAKPKHTTHTDPDDPRELHYQVVKLWKDGKGEKRPATVTVDILKDSVLQETVTLSADNDWTYGWTAPDDGAVWTVVEREVPADYTVVITAKETVFTITNTTQPDPPDGPQTGDSFTLIPWLIVMNVSGILLVLLGIYRKRFLQ